MLGARSLIVIAIATFAAIPSAIAQRDLPTCAGVRAAWNAVATGEDLAAMDRVIGNISRDNCPVLRAQADQRRAAAAALLQARAEEQRRLEQQRAEEEARRREEERQRLAAQQRERERREQERMRNEFMSPGSAVLGEWSLQAGFSSDPRQSSSFTAGGALDANVAGSSCYGTISPRPTLTVQYTAGGRPLYFSANSSEADLVIVVRAPDGSHHCDDDGGPGLNPQVRFSSPASGRYFVWIGRLGSGTAAATALVSNADLDPQVRANAADDEAWRIARQSNSASAYNSYLSAYPSGRHAGEARSARTVVLDDEAWQTARRTNTIAGYDSYLSSYSSGRHAADARSARQLLLPLQVRVCNNANQEVGVGVTYMPVGQSYWRGVGWYRITPGNCSTVFETRNGTFLIRAEPLDGSGSSWSSRAGQTQNSCATNPGPYDYTVTETCPSGASVKAFALFTNIDVTTGTFTWNLSPG